jgi:hypothetical protein
MSLLGRIALTLAASTIVVLLLLGGVFRLFRNPTTPPGYVGYVTRSAIMGQTHFYGLQTVVPHGHETDERPKTF